MARTAAPKSQEKDQVMVIKGKVKHTKLVVVQSCRHGRINATFSSVTSRKIIVSETKEIQNREKSTLIRRSILQRKIKLALSHEVMLNKFFQKIMIF
ncbi:UNKNOWN [Stylonychia lemnae]|uniref:Uncharacterized protein n=1 Tax=Stylonychia lemnae TaxID=5949 RepID=A0A077ZT49_STYLE|nr:UNKNOWN [Stylonychia lemnae]|eukprot:CDW72734.1 UNKNOWN [Stylonychia lemnae]